MGSFGGSETKGMSALERLNERVSKKLARVEGVVRANGFHIEIQKGANGKYQPVAVDEKKNHVIRYDEHPNFSSAYKQAHEIARKGMT